MLARAGLKSSESVFVGRPLFVKVHVIVLDKAFSLGRNQYRLFVCGAFCVSEWQEGNLMCQLRDTHTQQQKKKLHRQGQHKNTDGINM